MVVMSLLIFNETVYIVELVAVPWGLRDFSVRHGELSARVLS